MAVVHDLKIGPLFFAEVTAERKKAEFRKNDRNYQCGDFLLLREWDGEYSGKELLVKVTHILPVDKFIPECGDWVMLSIHITGIAALQTSVIKASIDA